MNFIKSDKNKFVKHILIFSSLFTFSLSLTSCNNKTVEKDEKGINYLEADSNPFNATINSIVATDVYGRSFSEGDVSTSDKKVGMFYFVWLGEHTNKGIFDVTKLMSTEEGSNTLWAQDYHDVTASPLYEFHYFSEPLYGYYCSDDPWVLARHIELLTMSGIDYISLDLTNISIYEKNVRVLLDSLLKYQKLGWRVPLVTSFIAGADINLNHPQRILEFYNIFMTDHKYDSLWLRDDLTNKPILAVDRSDQYANLDPVLTTNIKFRNTIWPYSKRQTSYDDASWLDWIYPQRVYNNSDGNYMSVSVTQHVAGSFGVSVNPNIKNQKNVRTAYAEEYNGFDTGGRTNYDSNRGRGWDYELNRNVKENVYKGTNLEQQWRNAITSEQPVDEVFVTGWNEWIAYKLPFEDIHGGSVRLDEIYSKYYDQVTFCDTCDEEFSRDLEMTKDGYGDNFYLQNMRLTREFKDENELRFAGKYVSANLKNLDWKTAREYLDFTKEVMERNFDRADHSKLFKYVNTTNRNDIASIKMSHDANNLYLQIKTDDDIVIDHEQNNNLNVLLSIEGSEEANWNGYNFILNRNDLNEGSGKTSLEAFTGEGFSTKKVRDCNYYLEDNVLSIAIPLIDLDVNERTGFTIDFKVADGISDPSDIMNYYIDGDSAPIGRLNYRYNSKHY